MSIRSAMVKDEWPTGVAATPKPIADTDQLYGTLLDYLCPSYHGEAVGGEKVFSANDLLAHLALEGYNTDKENSNALLGLLDEWAEYIPADMEETRGLKGEWSHYGVPVNAPGEHFGYAYDRRSLNAYTSALWETDEQTHADSAVPRTIGAASIAGIRHEEQIPKLTKNDMNVFDALQRLTPDAGWTMHEAVDALTKRVIQARPGSSDTDERRIREVVKTSVNNLIANDYINTARRHKGHRLLMIGKNASRTSAKEAPSKHGEMLQAEHPLNIALAAQLIERMLDPGNKSYHSHNPSKLISDVKDASKAEVNAAARKLIEMKILNRHVTTTAALKISLSPADRKALREAISAAGSVSAYLTIQTAKQSKAQ